MDYNSFLMKIIVVCLKRVWKKKKVDWIKKEKELLELKKSLWNEKSVV